MDDIPMVPGFEGRVISAQAGTREVPPGVLCYPQVDTWRDQVWSLLDDLITPEVRAAFIEDPPEWIPCDDLSWLDELVLDVTGVDRDIRSEAAARLMGHFRAFRAAHGTRTNDLTPFYTLGLRKLRAGEIEERARSLFLGGQFPHASETAFAAAIDELGAREPGPQRNGRLYFCAVESELYSRDGKSGHYLIYGSEYLYCLGIRTVSTWQARKTLKNIGRPTLLVCDIPMNLVGFGTMKEFAGNMLEYLFCELVDDMEAYSLSPGAGSAFAIAENLPAECIVGHYHPRTVHDPLG